MGFWELLIIAVGLSMDAFAVSICKGLSISMVNWKHAVIVGGYFGAFQALMPTLGYALGTRFQEKISAIDHWVAFVLLVIIGIQMIRESRQEAEETDPSLGPRAMVLLAVATSIDALAVGISFAFLQVDLAPAVLLIGTVTFVLSTCGVKVGSVFGTRFQAKAVFLGASF